MLEGPFTKLITHDSCADGLASAMIVRDALPGIEVVFAQYGQPSLEALSPSRGLLFCDITPPRERAAEFVAAGATVLDHHKHARDIVELFGERGVFADEVSVPGISGAWLAYEHVWRPLVPPGYGGDCAPLDFARLVGIRDTWQKDSPDWERANDLHVALMGMPRAYWLRPGGIAQAMSDDTRDLGRMWRAQRSERVGDVCETGSLGLTDSAGREWLAFPDAHGLTSDVAEAARVFGIPVTCGWFQLAEDGHVNTVLSLRSDGTVDVGALAKRFGGGGHSRAAGCKLPGENPLDAVRLVMGEA